MSTLTENDPNTHLDYVYRYLQIPDNQQELEFLNFAHESFERNDGQPGNTDQFYFYVSPLTPINTFRDRPIEELIESLNTVAKGAQVKDKFGCKLQHVPIMSMYLNRDQRLSIPVIMYSETVHEAYSAFRGKVPRSETLAALSLPPQQLKETVTRVHTTNIYMKIYPDSLMGHLAADIHRGKYQVNGDDYLHLRNGEIPIRWVISRMNDHNPFTISEGVLGEESNSKSRSDTKGAKGIARMLGLIRSVG
jgi:hypothetical protein